VSALVIVPFLFPCAIFIAMLAYNVKHQGCLSWDYRWRSRDEAPALFWYSVVVLTGATLFFVWLALPGYDFRI
jgi:hypothetical protein